MTDTTTTTIPARVPGRRGRLPQLQGPARLAIRWAHQYVAAPEPTYPIDVSTGITDWGMLGNDRLGDCGPCGVAHERMIGGAVPTTAEVEALYLQYTGGQDVGVVIADFLLWLYQEKLIEGFAPVQLGSVDALMGQLSRGVILGVNLTDDAEDLFSAQQPWTVAHGERPDESEGHVILKIKSAAARGVGVAVTWGADQDLEGPWQEACVEEAWVILTPEDVDEEGYAALVTDLEALPHATGPMPPPAPPVVTPPPVPEPVPAPPDPAPPAPAPTPPEPGPTPTPAPPSPSVHGFIERIRHIAQRAERDIAEVADEFTAWIEAQ